MSELQCVFQCDESSNVHLNTLSEDQLVCLHEKLKIRKKLKIKYHDLKLPDALLDTHGYHRNCFSNFSYIKPQYMKKYEEACRKGKNYLICGVFKRSIKKL